MGKITFHKSPSSEKFNFRINRANAAVSFLYRPIRYLIFQALAVRPLPNRLRRGCAWKPNWKWRRATTWWWTCKFSQRLISRHNISPPTPGRRWSKSMRSLWKPRERERDRGRQRKNKREHFMNVFDSSTALSGKCYTTDPNTPGNTPAHRATICRHSLIISVNEIRVMRVRDAPTLECRDFVLPRFCAINWKTKSKFAEFCRDD